MCAHLGTYFEVGTILHLLYATSIYYFDVTFTILCDDVCNYVCYRDSLLANCVTLSKQYINKKK